MRRETADEPDRGERTGALGERRFGNVWISRGRTGVLAIGHEPIIADCAEEDRTETDIAGSCRGVDFTRVISQNPVFCPIRIGSGPATLRLGPLAILKFMRDERGLLEALLSDGRFLLSITGLMLVLSGGFGIFQSLTGYFLPQDVHALGFDARQLAAAANMRVVHFMFHDRVAFGGTLLAASGRILVLVPGGVPAEGRRRLGLVDVLCLGHLRLR